MKEVLKNVNMNNIAEINAIQSKQQIRNKQHQ